MKLATTSKIFIDDLSSEKLKLTKLQKLITNEVLTCFSSRPKSSLQTYKEKINHRPVEIDLHIKDTGKKRQNA